MKDRFTTGKVRDEMVSRSGITPHHLCAHGLAVRIRPAWRRTIAAALYIDKPAQTGTLPLDAVRGSIELGELSNDRE